MTYKSEKWKRYKESQLAKGLCSVCTSPLVTSSFCARHRDIARAKAQKWRDAHPTNKLPKTLKEKKHPEVQVFHKGSERIRPTYSGAPKSRKKLKNMYAHDVECKSPKVINPNNHYFHNPTVEALVAKYLATACTDIKLRNEIMQYAMELIRQIIMHNKYNVIVPGRNMDDLVQVAWMQIEKTLYKFNMDPGHTTLFNMWTQVTKTVLLAHIKREWRDVHNYPGYKNFKKAKWSGVDYKFERFLLEAREFFKFDDTALKIIDAMESLYREDEDASNGIISKLIARTKMRRIAVAKFMKELRLLAGQFTDSPLSMDRERIIEAREERENDEE